MPRIRQRVALLLEQIDTILHNIGEEVSTALQLVIDVVQTVNEVEELGPEAMEQHIDHRVFSLRPIFGCVDQILMIHNHQYIIVGEISADRIG